MSLVKNFSRNLQYQVLGMVVSFLAAFIVTPYVLQRVDHELYGLYVLMYSVVAYFNIMDFGLNSAIIKYTAEYHAKQDWKEFQKIMNLSLTLFLGIGLFCGLCLIGFSFFYQHFFRIKPDFLLYGRYFIWITGIDLVLSMFFLPIKGALSGLQRADIVKKISIVATVLKIPVVFGLFHFFNSGTAFLLYLLYDGTFIYLLYVFGMRRLFALCPEYKMNFCYFDKHTFKKIFKFSVFGFFGGITSLIIFQTDNIVIASLAAVSLVTYYNIATTLTNHMRTINYIMGGPIFLAVAHLAGRDDKEKNTFMLFKSTKLMNAIFAPIILITMMFCEVFILAWLGPEFSISVLPARILLLYWLFNGHFEPASGFLVARAMVDITFYMNLGNAICNLVLSIILVKYLGIVGVALGTFIPMCIFTIMTMYICLRKLQVSIREFFKEALLKNIIFYSIPLFLSFITLKLMALNNIFVIIAAMGTTFLLSELLYFLLFMDKEERALVLSIAKINL